MRRRRTVYVASPYGFSAQQRRHLLPEFVRALADLGAEPHEPFSHNRQVAFAREPGWAFEVGQRDRTAVSESDAILAIVNGNPPDEGVMVELGIAIALGKPTFLFRDDFRRSGDSAEYPLNLMIFTGLPEHGWEDYWYTSLDELGDPDKALMHWLREDDG